MTKLSIIIPVYNTEDYLEECLKSVINQSLKEIEIIIIDDGSTDNSLKIAREFEKKDSKIKVFEEKNQGAATARNIGIEKARGEYITFVDSDDAININTYKYLYNLASANNYDLLKFNIELVFDNKRMAELVNKEIAPEIKIIQNRAKILDNHVSACSKILKTDFLKENNLTFPDNLAYEDILFHWKCCLYAKNSALVEYPFYFYRKGIQSTSLIKSKKTFDIFKIHEMTLNLIKEKSPQDLKIYEKNIVKHLPFYYDKIPFLYRIKFLKKTKELFSKIGIENIKNESTLKDKQLTCIIKGKYFLFLFYEIINNLKKLDRFVRIFVEQLC